MQSSEPEPPQKEQIPMPEPWQKGQSSLKPRQVHSSRPEPPQKEHSTFPDPKQKGHFSSILIPSNKP